MDRSVAEPVREAPHGPAAAAAAPESPAAHAAYPSLRRGVIPALNGWRAVCILLVLAHHSAWAVGGPAIKVGRMGELGVRFFFVISGFLITVLMLREVAAAGTGRLDVRAFFKRRCLRILPVYYTFVAVVLILEIATPYHLGTGEWIATLTFTRNYYGDDWTTGHLWSLGVEQQFYLFWPFAFQALTPARTPLHALKWLAVPLLLCPLLHAAGTLLDLPGPLGWRSFLVNADSLAGGCALAILLWHWGDRIAAALRGRQHLLLGLGLFLAFGPLGLHLHGRLFILAFAIAPIQILGLVILLALSVKADASKLFRCLEWRWIAAIGIVSYSLYMWQNLFCTDPAVFGGGPAWWNRYPTWMLAALAAAILSYHAVEKPFLKLKKKSHRPG